MRFQIALLPVIAASVLLAGCTTSAPAAAGTSAGQGDFSYLRTPTSFQSFGRDDRTYETAYTAPADWSESASRNSFMYWNAVMAVRTGHACFAIQALKANRREEIGSSRLDPAGPTSPGAPLNTRPPTHFYEFTALTVFPDCATEGAVDAKDYLSRTNRPEQAPRKVAPH